MSITCINLPRLEGTCSQVQTLIKKISFITNIFLLPNPIYYGFLISLRVLSRHGSLTQHIIWVISSWISNPTFCIDCFIMNSWHNTLVWDASSWTSLSRLISITTTIVEENYTLVLWYFFFNEKSSHLFNLNRFSFTIFSNQDYSTKHNN